MVSRALALAAALAVAAPVPGRACEIALAFALDVSASVDARDYRLQRDGLARALTAPEVARVILALPGGAAFAAYEWSGRDQQTLIVDWTPVSDRAALEGLAARISGSGRSHSEFPTALGYALGYGARLVARAPDCRRRVIDVSGDGKTNDGFGPKLAYDAFPFTGITVNGLVIEGTDFGVTAYYRATLPHGPGAFVERADGYADYARAMRRKLLRELLGPQMVDR